MHASRYVVLERRPVVHYPSSLMIHTVVVPLLTAVSDKLWERWKQHDTPKYGLIYHASLIGQATPKNKGKISRVLAAKCSLAIRVDALADETDTSIGIESRAKVRRALLQWDEIFKRGFCCRCL